MLTFWYELASTYSFLAAERIEALAVEKRVSVHWQPFLLGPIFKARGYADTPFNTDPVKGRYMWRDMERWCNRLGLPLLRPEPFPQNGLHAARIALALPDDARPLFTKALYRLEFCEGRAIDVEATLSDALQQAGLEFETVLVAAKTPLVKDALKRKTEDAQRLGIFGAPAFITSDGELFWGNDRLEEALDWECGKR